MQADVTSDPLVVRFVHKQLHAEECVVGLDYITEIGINLVLCGLLLESLQCSLMSELTTPVLHNHTSARTPLS